MTYRDRITFVTCDNEVCDFCASLMKMANRQELCNLGGFFFEFVLDKLLWKKQVEIGNVRELYPVCMNDGTMFLIEKGREDRVTTASADKITEITGVQWQYVYCENS